jgi:hypothetical protein
LFVVRFPRYLGEVMVMLNFGFFSYLGTLTIALNISSSLVKC